MSVFDDYKVTHLRDKATRAALWVSGHIPNGPTAGDLHRAANGEGGANGEDLLLAIALILRRATSDYR